ncbi:MAG TPA: chemotaxis protein CheW [Pedomonas sp.]|uniref:chemotaxis protein CheW n=1 Tax=Pedomonas sp. TaxID=2976421 RepID=UPI002F406B48
MVESAAGMRPAAQVQAERFLTFFLGEDVFALPVAVVHEVMRRPSTVSVPQSPPCLEGLANFRGKVLPVTSLRQLVGLEDTVAGEDTRVVVINHGGPVGLTVDRLGGLATGHPTQVASADGIGPDMATASIRLDDKGGHARVVPVGDLLERTFGKRARPAAVPIVKTTRKQAGESQAGEREMLALIGFEAAGQHYALPLERVQEVIPLPAEVTQVPRSGTATLGVIAVRDRLLPLVSLRGLLGLPPAAQQRGRIIVVSLGNAQVGLVADRMGAILRVEQKQLDPVPAALRTSDGDAEIQAICRLDDGQLISLLAPERLLRADVTERAMTEAGAGRSEDMNDAMSGKAKVEQFVVFHLAGDEFGLPIDSVVEIIRVPEVLTRLPKTPSFVEGIVNLRGGVVPIIDQRQRFDLPAIERSRQQRIVVVRVNGMRAGFIVDTVSGILAVRPEEITSADTLSVGASTVFTRVANQPDRGRMVLLIDPAELLDQTETRLLEQMNGKKRSARTS